MPCCCCVQVINNIGFREFLELYPEVRAGNSHAHVDRRKRMVHCTSCTVHTVYAMHGLQVWLPVRFSTSGHMLRAKAFAPVMLQVRDMVHDFYNSRYATCFAALEALKPMLSIDIHLHDHVKALLSEIKTRALVQVRADTL